MNNRGFTLLEMVIALAVFSVVGLISSQILSHSVDYADRLNNRGGRLVEVQRALDIIDRDFSQIVHRNVRDELGDRLDAIVVGDGTLQFTRTGWSNPRQARRSTMQRVEYEHAFGAITRRYWNVLDRAPDSEPNSQIVLSGVDELVVLFFDTNGESYPYWPPAQQPGPGGGVELSSIKVIFDAAPFERISRTWAVPRKPVPVEERP